MSTSEWGLPLCFECRQSVRRARTAKPATAVASRKKKKKKVGKEKAERGRTPDAVHRVAFSEVSAFTLTLCGADDKRIPRVLQSRWQNT